MAIQTYLRAPGFVYSEQAPVDGGYDQSGFDVVAAFLEEKSGYCIHYAATMAIMARIAGIPSRMAVGYAPGRPTGTVIEDGPGADLKEFEVDSRDAHAWPELFFSGVGWVSFEPTPSRGVLPAYARAKPPPPPPPRPTTSFGPRASPGRPPAPRQSQRNRTRRLRRRTTCCHASCGRRRPRPSCWAFCWRRWRCAAVVPRGAGRRWPPAEPGAGPPSPRGWKQWIPQRTWAGRPRQRRLRGLSSSDLTTPGWSPAGLPPPCPGCGPATSGRRMRLRRRRHRTATTPPGGRTWKPSRAGSTSGPVGGGAWRGCSGRPRCSAAGRPESDGRRDDPSYLA